MKRITVLGSTGSIGTQTLDVVSMHPDQFTVEALAGGSNIKLLAEQAHLYKPKKCLWVLGSWRMKFVLYCLLE